MSISAVIPAGGIGKRFDASGKKQFFEINGKPIIYYTLKRLNDAYNFNEFVIGAATEDHEYLLEIADRAGIDSLLLTLNGPERADTVLNAVTAASGEYVLVHDAVRPFVSNDIIYSTIEAGIDNSGAICGLFSKDTIKYVENNIIKSTIDRDNIFLAHTPQVFKREKLIDAMTLAMSKGIKLTDEASAFESAGYSVKVVLSTVDNLKITEKGDINILPVLVKKYFG